MTLSENIIKDITKKLEEKNTNIDFFRDQILTVDAEKSQYDNAINILDNNLLSKIEEVNNTLYDTKDAYQDRINVGCRTDLFWRIVGFSTGNFSLGTFNTFTLKCTKLSLSGYEKFPSVIPIGIGNTNYGSIVRYFDGTQFTNYPLNNKFGWIEDNLHGIKYYDEPITTDIGDTKIASFIGSIGIGSTTLIVMTPFDNGLSDGGLPGTLDVNLFKVNQLVISDKEGVFPQSTNRIVGVSTSIADFAELTDIQTSEISGVLYFVDSSGKILGLANSILNSGIDVGDGSTIPFDINETYTISSGIIGGSGSGASFLVERDSIGSIDSVEVISGGSAYEVGDQLLIPGSLIGGGGNVETVTFSGTSVGAAATFTNVTGTTNGNGVGASFDIERDGSGIITDVVIIESGFRYEIGDTITILGSSVGGVDVTDDVEITVTQISDNDLIYINVFEVLSPSIITVVNTLILENMALSDVSIPEPDGSFVTFTVLDDPDNISNVSEYSIAFKSNPFSPQTIGIMSSNNIGIGRNIEYDNSGNLPNTQSWKPENAIQGVEDVPDVVEPSVGAGKIYYKVGFTQRPINPDTGLPAVEGESISIFTFDNIYEELSPCQTQETNLTNKINIRDLKEAEFANELGEFNTLLQASSALRSERDIYNSRIWGLRQSIGGEIEEIDRYNALDTYIKSSSVTNIVN